MRLYEIIALIILCHSAREWLIEYGNQKYDKCMVYDCRMEYILGECDEYKIYNDFSAPNCTKESDTKSFLRLEVKHFQGNRQNNIIRDGTVTYPIEKDKIDEWERICQSFRVRLFRCYMFDDKILLVDKLDNLYLPFINIVIILLYGLIIKRLYGLIF